MPSRFLSLLRSKEARSASAKKEGDAQLKAGRLDQAEASYREALAVDERNVAAHIGLGNVYRERKDVASARRALGSALAIDPVNADAHYTLAKFAAGEGDHSGAIRHLEHAIAARTAFDLAYADLIALLVATGQDSRVEEVMASAISACPESAALHNVQGRRMGLQRNFAAAIESFRKAVSLAPGTKEYHKSLGDALDDSGDYAAAVESFEQAVWLDPDYVDARKVLARALVRAGRYDSAVVHYEHLVDRDPGNAELRVNLGVALQAQGKIDQAIACYRRGVELDPAMPSAHSNLAILLEARGDRNEAIAHLEKASALDPSSQASFYLLALKGGKSDRAPSEFVEKLFDFYAPNFDSHLVTKLRYTVPDKLAAALQPYAPTGNYERWNALDLGCGTGLAGVAVAPYSRAMVGVDISARMLDKARERNIYERLEQGDLLPMMQAEPPAHYDLVLSADVFVYIGRLDELMAEAHRLLRHGGLCAFSVESLDALEPSPAGGDAPDYRLNDTGRFAHSAVYLDRLCRQIGFESLALTDIESRENKGNPVSGYLALWRKPRVDETFADRGGSRHTSA